MKLFPAFTAYAATAADQSAFGIQQYELNVSFFKKRLPQLYFLIFCIFTSVPFVFVDGNTMNHFRYIHECLREELERELCSVLSFIQSADGESRITIEGKGGNKRNSPTACTQSVDNTLRGN